VRTRFRAYPTFEAGARDYVETLSRHPQATAAARRGDATGFIEALDRRGYFDEKPSGYARAVEQLARELDTKPFAER
jgi:flagellum-specific peptidoglycan hydrolase FlgJ